MTASKLADLRAELARRDLQGFLVPRADEHLGEYVAPGAERLAWLTGFTGSAGLAIVLADRAALFVDGRYVLQAATQTDPALWERRHVTEEPPQAWLAEALQHRPGARVGYDPWLIAEEGLQRFAEVGAAMVPTEPNPIDMLWHDRPGPPLHPAEPHPLAYAGRGSAEKREEVAAMLRAARQDAAVLTDPAAVAWLLNIRGSDVPFTPFALGFAILQADATAALFMSPQKLPPATRAWLGNAVALHDRAALPGALDALKGRRVRVDPATAPVWFAQRLRAAGAILTPGADPCLLPKASKNPVEQAGARAAQLRDATALVRFLHWLEAAPGHETELSAADRLLALRGELEEFRGESFPAISAAGEHGAIMHYRVGPESNRPIRADELYLIDSGAQFPDGTTDATRTVWTGQGMPPAELRDRFTRVLKGHIAIATLVFPLGAAGAHLDGFARHALWQVGLDYDHGTGHGVGSYLSVHEGPVSLSRLAKPVPLAPGMILSNEPGFYAPGRFGIRLENLVLVQPATLPDAGRPFLRFETLTLAPFDRRLIEPALLSLEEIAWIDTYHARVLAEVGPALAPEPRTWLAGACARLVG
jgi:Xaa-Pro aminopeptidase